MTAGTIADPLLAHYGRDRLLKVADLLKKSKEHGFTIATAESLTAGGIANFLASLSGSSNMLDCGYVVYNNQAKTRMLGVDPETLRVEEAVSNPVAEQMARGALERSNAHMAVSVTGYAGASGDDVRNIPGGTVFVGLAVRDALGKEPGMVQVSHYVFPTERTACRLATLDAAMDALEKGMDHLIERKQANAKWAKTIAARACTDAPQQRLG